MTHDCHLNPFVPQGLSSSGFEVEFEVFIPYDYHLDPFVLQGLSSRGFDVKLFPQTL